MSCEPQWAGDPGVKFLESPRACGHSVDGAWRGWSAALSTPPSCPDLGCPISLPALGTSNTPFLVPQQPYFGVQLRPGRVAIMPS